MSEQVIVSDAELKEWLKPVQDPELFIGLVDLGLIYSCEANAEGHAKIKMTLTSPGCPAGDYLVQAVQTRAKEHERISEAEVEIVWEPQWNPEEMASEEAKEQMGIW